MFALLAVAVSLGSLDGGVVTETRSIMHTDVTVTLAEPPPKGSASHAEAFEEAFRVFEHVDAVMNEWREDSVLGRVNAQAGGEAVTAPKTLCEVVQLALAGAKTTDGLFDPTWAALRGVWRFGTDVKAELPKPDVLKGKCALVSWKHVQLVPLKQATTDAACTLRLERAGMQLGLGGIAKGWGVDEAVKRLRARGYKNFFVQAGGDLYAAGKRDGRPWRVGVRDPRGEGTFAMLDVSDAAFSTSGDYERFFMLDGVRYHHIIDLRDCQPARASSSATVLAKRAVDAEVLTKAAFVLGGEKGAALAKKLGAEVVLVSASGEVHVSAGLKGKLELRRK